MVEKLKKIIDETDKCYIEYELDEYDRGTGLICTYKHSENSRCLLDKCEFCNKYSDECRCYDNYKKLNN